MRCAILREGLLFETLHYKDEIKSSEPYFDAIRAGKPNAEELDLAKELLKRKTANFDPGKVHDH